MLGETPLTNVRFEKYCLLRISGKTKKQALIEVYPGRAKWKDESLWNKAYAMEKRKDIKARLSYLRQQAAKDAILSKSELLAGMSETFQESLNSIRNEGLGRDAIQGISSLGKTLLSELPDDTPEAEQVYIRDFGLLIAEPFMAAHRRISTDEGGEFWFYGGRASTKSSCISLEIVDGLMKYSKRSALICVKRKTDIREGVYEQMLWALRKHNVIDMWECTVSPMRMVNKATKQAITFRGSDKAEKTKAIKAPNGTYYAYQWFEEADQFFGMQEIRTIRQSATRDAGHAAPYFRFYSFNPPRSKSSWANKQIELLKQQGHTLYKANYNDVPKEWIPQQIYDDAQNLRKVDEEAFLHEYMGEPVGFGAEVFPRACVRTITEDERKNLEYFYYGIDWGFSQDPWVWLKAAYDAKTRTLYILDEMSGLGLSNEQTSHMVLKRMSKDIKDEAGNIIEDAQPYAEVVCDAAEPKSIATYRECGINAIASPKQGAHNVKNSIRWLCERTQIVIDPTCTIAAREFPAYQYEMTKDGEVTGLLPDKDNHAIDALRYAAARLIDDRQMI